MAANPDMLQQIMKQMQLLQGLKDSRGPQGILSRGANIYNAGSLAAQQGGGLQYGRYNPLQEAAQRRLFQGI
jgi:hypothetical protein